jgi:hypothetical protein
MPSNARSRLRPAAAVRAHRRRRPARVHASWFLSSARRLYNRRAGDESMILKTNAPARFAAIAAGLALLTIGALALHAADKPEAPAKQTAANRYFEMRTYHVAPGKLDALNARFRDHTMALFKKHGMDNVGYWTPAEGQPGAGNTLVYLMAYPSKEARDASWKEFNSDPEWKTAKAESEREGKLVEKVDQLFLNPTDYSDIK